MSSLTEDQAYLLHYIHIGEIESVEGYLEAFPPPDSINYEDEQVTSLALTPLICSVHYKQHAVTDLLLAKGANPCHITKTGANALSTAIKVNDAKMIGFFQSSFKARVWGGGEDRLLVEQVQGLMDNYYPASAAKEDDSIRSYRAYMVPKLQHYRTQQHALSSEDIQFLQSKKAILEKLLQERAHNDLKREMLAKQFPEKDREAFIQADIAAHQKELEEGNRARKEKQALAQKAAELEQKAQALEAKLQEAQHQLQAHSQQVTAKHSQLAQDVRVLEQKVSLLWDEYEAEAEVKAQQMQIRQDDSLYTFYQGVKRRIHTFFVGRQVARSGEVVVAGPSTLVKDALTLAGDVIPIPTAGIVLKALGHVAQLYQNYKKGKRDQRVDGGLAALASDSSELSEEIVEPASRRLTLMGAAQLRCFDKPQVSTLAECAVRLMLVYIVYELPTNPQVSYAEVIQQLLLAVHLKRVEGVKIKDINGNTIKPKTLKTREGKPVSESKVFAAFDSQVISLRPASPSAQPRPAKTAAPPLSIAVKPQPVKAAALRLQAASPPPSNYSRVIPTAQPSQGAQAKTPSVMME